MMGAIGGYDVESRNRNCSLSKEKAGQGKAAALSGEATVTRFRLRQTFAQLAPCSTL
jgi:hypothetical protein